MKLSNRLHTVSTFITPQSILADIGTDHGYIPIFLVSNGTIPFAYAMDINEGPLERAKSHIDENGLADKIQVRLSNGLDKLGENEADSILIAGMGGALTVDILSRGWKVAKSAKELILSPHSEVFLVREYLQEKGYRIVREEMIKDMDKYYVIMKWVKGLEEKYSECELLYGPLMLKNKDKICFEFLNKEKDNFIKILKAMPDNGKSDTQKRKTELLEKIKVVECALKYFD